MAVNVLFLLLVWVLNQLLCFCSQAEGQEAILHASNGPTLREYCLLYNSTWSNISDSLSAAVSYPLRSLVSSQLCVRGQQGSLEGQAVVVMRGGCDFSQKALVAQDLGASVLLIASVDNLVIPSANDSELRKVKIPLALVRHRDVLDALQVFPQGMEVRLYAPPVPPFDASIIIMLLIAVFTVTTGGIWSGAAENELSLYSPLKVLLFVAMMCVMLVLMYFFYRWLVYVIIVIFCLASASALYNCLDSLALGCSTLSPIINTSNGESIMVQVALGPGAGGKGQALEVPGDNTSSYEKLPVVMRIPQFSALAQNLCMMQFSILGYGDIIIPGLLVAYCHRFDVWMGNSRRIYFISCAVAYAVGLVLTFAVMLLSKMGQPALLYLVPCTLLTSAVLACVRKEFRLFWSGSRTCQVRGFL
uniref:PA domain-containing protein n=1 Tax=Cyprinus carpio TaxID=7962 RepID=A0A8C1T3B7_CYPCA